MMVREVVTLLVLSKGQIHHSRGLDLRAPQGLPACAAMDLNPVRKRRFVQILRQRGIRDVGGVEMQLIMFAPLDEVDGIFQPRRSMDFLNKISTGPCSTLQHM